MRLQLRGCVPLLALATSLQLVPATAGAVAVVGDVGAVQIEAEAAKQAQNSETCLNGDTSGTCNSSNIDVASASIEDHSSSSSNSNNQNTGRKMGGGGRLFYTILGFSIGSGLTYLMFLLQEAKRKRDKIEYEEYFGTASVRAKLAEKLGGSEDLISGIMQRLWTVGWNPALSSMIEEMMGPMLKESFPTGPLSGMEVTKLDFGPAPMQLDNIVVHDVSTTDDDAGNASCQFDMDVLWDGLCDIQIRVPKIKSNLGVRSIKLYGRMSVIFKPLTQELPCIAGITYTFINSPHISIDLTGLASIGEFSALDGTVKQALKDALDGMIVLPHRMAYKMDETCNILKMYTPPKGIVRLFIVSSRGFVVEKRTLARPDIPDVYCNVSVGNARTVRTKTVPDNLAPSWENEPMDFVLHDYDEFLNLNAWDEDGGALDPDDDLGKISSSVRIRDLLLAPDSTMELELFDSSDYTKSMGAFVTVQCAILPLSPVEPVETSLPATEDPKTGLITKHLYPGMINVLVSQATGISTASQKAGTFVDMKLSTGESVVSSTLLEKDPVYDGVFEVPLSPKMVKAKPSVTLTLYQVSKNATKVTENLVLGSTTITWDELQVHPVIQQKRKISKSGIFLEFNVTLRGTSASGFSEQNVEVADPVDGVAAVISNVAADAAAGVGGKLVESAASVRFSEPKVKPTGVKVLATSPKPIKPKLTAANPHSSSISSLPPNLKPTKTNIPSVGAGVSAAQLGVTGSSSNIGGPTRKVRIIAVRGSGFVIRRKGPLRKKDIPDVYLKIKVGTEKKWQTSVIKNSIKPEWNESKIFDLSNVNATSLLVEAWDKNKGKLDKDDCYGHAMTRVGKVLLSGGTANLELLGGKSETEATGLFITIFCSLER